MPIKKLTHWSYPKKSTSPRNLASLTTKILKDMLVGQNSQLTIDYTTQKTAKYKTDYKKVSKIRKTVVIKRNKISHKKVRQKSLHM